MSNDWSGPDLHLDVYSDTKIGFMGNGDHFGQYWVFTPIEEVCGVCGNSGIVVRTLIPKGKICAVSTNEL